MPIRMTCPNEECGRKLAFKDEFGGKKTRCPSCKTILVIPQAEDEVEAIEEKEPEAPQRSAKPRPAPREREPVDDDDYDEEEEAPRERPEKRRQKPTRRAEEDEDDEEEEEEERITKRRKQSARRSRRDEDDEDEQEEGISKERRQRPRRRPRDDYDEEDEYDDEDEWDRQLKPAHETGSTMILTYVCVALFIVVAITPTLSWISLTAKFPRGEFTESISGFGKIKITAAIAGRSEIEMESELKEEKPEGMLFMILGFLVATGFGLGFLATQLKLGNEKIASYATLFAAAASITFLIWTVGWIGKVTMLSREGASLGGSDTLPGLGLAIATGLSAVLAYLTSFLGGRYVSKKIVYLWEGGGLLVGALLLVVVTQPWTAEELFKALGNIDKPS